MWNFQVNNTDGHTCWLTHTSWETWLRIGAHLRDHKHMILSWLFNIDDSFEHQLGKILTLRTPFLDLCKHTNTLKHKHMKHHFKGENTTLG